MLRILIGTQPNFRIMPTDLLNEVTEKLNEVIPLDASQGVSAKSFQYNTTTKISSGSNSRKMRVQVSVSWAFGSFSESLDFDEET